MDTTIVQYLIICPLVMLAGFVDAVAGGGGLISLPAYMICGVPVHAAIATNKMSSAMGTVLVTFKYARNGFIPWRLALSAILFAIAGSALGARLALWLPSRDLLIALLICIPVAAFYVLLGKMEIEREPFSRTKTAILAMGISFVCGIYDGVSGPGTGTFLILLFTGLAHLTMKQANGVTKVINSATNLAALAVFLSHGMVLFPLGIIAGVFGMAGNYLGAWYFSKGGAANTKPIMLTILSIFFIRVIYELFIK